MYIRAALLALAVGCATATEIQRRGFPFRPGRIDTEPVDTPSPPLYHSSADDVPRIGTAPRIGHDYPEDTTPEYQPAAQPNECFREQCADLTKEIAEQVIDQMIKNLMGSSSTASHPMPHSGGFGTQVQPPVVTASATRSPVPNFNVAKTMTLAQEDIALFNDEEQDMYYHDRMCFYANVKQQYASVASASPTPTTLARRDNIGDYINNQATASATALASSDAAHYQSALWATLMPTYILSIYSPVAANNSMTTATTTCSGLGGAASITMSYVQARVSSHSPTPNYNSNMVEGAANVQAEAGRSAIFGGVVALLGLIAL